MSRKIKFRAWDELKKIMYSLKCVNLLLHFDGELQSTDEYGNILGTINTPEMKIMQYTGLKDSKRTEEYPKGQEIYEGDIVKNIKTGKMYTIKWHGVFAGFIYDDTFFNHSHKSEWGELYLCSMKLEVISNIYENKDLLEVE